MKSVCPLCNGLYQIDYNCHNCNTKMIDKGPKVNYIDDYSPYLLDEITNQVDGVKQDECLHIFQCPCCGSQQKYSIKRKEF